MADHPALQKAIDLATRAVEADKKRDYREAASLYLDAGEYFQHAAVFEAQGDRQRDAILAKCKTYIDRAKLLEDYLRKGKGKPVKAEGGSGGKENETIRAKCWTYLDGAKNINDYLEKNKANTDTDATAGGSAQSALQKAIDLVTRATEADKKKDYQEALNLYAHAVDYFLHAVKYEAQSYEQKDAIRAKCTTYLGRAEKLRDYLSKGKPGGDGGIGGKKGGGTSPDAKPDALARQAMFRRHLDNTEHCLTEADFRTLAEDSDGCSAADISMVVREALMQPARVVQSATHFSAPSRSDPAVELHDYLTPCSPGASGAAAMGWTEVPGGRLLAPPVSVGDMTKALAVVRVAMELGWSTTPHH